MDPSHEDKQPLRGTSPHNLSSIPRDERTLLSRTYHRRMRTLTNVAVVLCIGSCLVYDWDTYLGTDKHVFSGIRPAVRRTMDWMYGIEEPPAPTPAQRASARKPWPGHGL